MQLHITPEIVIILRIKPFSRVNKLIKYTNNLYTVLFPKSVLLGLDLNGRFDIYLTQNMNS